jgi:hypothetical protein
VDTKEKSLFDPKALYETWERAANGWFDTWSKSPAFLSAMGKTLEAQLGMKSGADRWIETWCETWRIPTAKDVEALSSQVSDLEARVAGLEEQLGAPAMAGKGEARS